MLDFVDYKPLTRSERTRNLKTIRKGNQTLAKHALRLFGNRKRKHLRALLFVELPKGKFSLKKNKIPKADFIAIMDVKAIEVRMLEGYARMIRMIACRWWKTTHVATGAELEDYVQVASLYFIDALYSYGVGKNSKQGNRYIAFSTYICNSMNKKMMDYVARNKLLGGLSLADFLKFGKFEKFVAMNPGMSYDDLISQFGFNEEEIKIYENWKRKVICESQLNELSTAGGRSKKRDDSYDSNTSAFHEPDYSAMSPKSCETYEEDCNPQMLEAIEKVREELTEFEDDVLMSSTNDRGWATEVAARHTNPNTGKPYSRMASGLVLKKIHERIREKYQSILSRDSRKNSKV